LILPTQPFIRPAQASIDFKDTPHVTH